MSACVRACRSIYMPLVSLHVSCLSLSWGMFSHTDVCKSVLVYTSFVRKYFSTYSMSRMYISIHVRTNACMCTYKLSFVRTCICMYPMYVCTDGRTFDGHTYVCLYMFMCECNRKLYSCICMPTSFICMYLCMSIGRSIYNPLVSLRVS